MNLPLYSIRFSDTKNSSAMHFHDCYELLFIVEGTIEIQINESVFTAKAGDVAIINRRRRHSINVLSDTYKRFVLSARPFLDYSEHKKYSVLLNRPSGFNNIFNAGENAEKIEKLFNEIIEESKMQDSYSEEMQHSLINQLLITLCRTSSKSFGSFTSKQVDMILDIQNSFEENYRYPYSLEELSKKYSVSVSLLSHSFKKATGYSVFDYLYSCRIAAAKYFLVNSDLAIGDIVERCGFSDNSNFSRTFKKTVGLTPSQFRNKNVQSI